jgi:O-antigen chain-terminating methyltransferase
VSESPTGPARPAAHERLDARIARLARERGDADARYNEALTALDRAQTAPVDMPHPPPPYDESQLPSVNAHWRILDEAAPVVDGSLKGRLRGFIWRLVGPPLDRQQHFNAAVVDHLNRNVAAHREAARAAETTIEMLRQQVEAAIRFQSHLIQYLQTITLYVDTKDRAVQVEAQVLNEGLAAISADWLKRWESLAARDRRVLDRLSEVDDLRTTAALAQQTALSLKREVERLPAFAPGGASSSVPAFAPGGASSSAPAFAPAEAPSGREGATARQAPPDLDAYKYLGFEESFRGSVEDIRARLASYVPIFEGQSDVLDIGCGRGEFLELLRGAGISARGLDLNHEMAEAARARGLEVAEGDALAYLQSLPDASLGGLFAAQVVEHLEPGYLMRLLETAAHKVRPGGAIVLETINPACWVAFFESYIRDLTHQRALHPETLQYLVRASGFRDVRIEYRSPIPERDRLQPLFSPATLPAEIADFVEIHNSNIEKLNGRMYGFMDYAVVGRR